MLTTTVICGGLKIKANASWARTLAYSMIVVMEKLLCTNTFAVGLSSLVLLAGGVSPCLAQVSSSTGSVQTFKGDSKPAGPTSVSALGLPEGGFKITWIDNSSSETGFEIQRSPAFAAGPQRLGANTTVFVDKQVLSKAKYRVRSIGARLNSSWSSWVEARAVGSTFLRLSPGSGFSGPTPQPETVGIPSDAGFDAKAIARWNVVPYQTFTGTFMVGVVAFHMNGIDRVEFSANGGRWVAVREMQMNPQSGTMEFTAQLRAADFGDGPAEIRAVVYPRGAGVPRVLGGDLASAALSNGEHSLMLRSDASQQFGPPDLYVSASRGNDTSGDGTLARPYATVWRAMTHHAGRNIDGLDILLEPGNYDYGTTLTSSRPTTSQGWVTIRPVPGSARESVRFVTGGRYRVGNIRLKDVVLDFSAGGSIGNFTQSTLPSMFWLDGVRAIGPGPATGARAVPPANWRALYMNDTRIESFTDGAMFAQIARNVHLQTLGSDAFTGSKLVVNCTADDVTIRAGTRFHPDIYQFAVTPGQVVENNIVFGLQATNAGAQGIFADDGGTVNNVAFVNVLIEKTTGGFLSQWKDVTSNHVLFWQTTLINQSMAWRTTRHTNISIRGSAWHSLEGLTMLQTPGAYIDVRNNHFVRPLATTFGIDTTTGPLMWDVSGSNRFVPAAGSPLLRRSETQLVRVDLLNLPRSSPDATGAITRVSSESGN